MSARPLEAGERAGDALAQGLGAVDVTCRGNADRLGHRADVLTLWRFHKREARV